MINKSADTHKNFKEVRPAKTSSGRVCSSLLFNVLYEECQLVRMERPQLTLTAVPMR
jgi:hypothetical protein